MRRSQRGKSEREKWVKRGIANYSLLFVVGYKDPQVNGNNSGMYTYMLVPLGGLILNPHTGIIPKRMVDSLCRFPYKLFRAILNV